MADKTDGSGSTTQIIVAIIGVVGVISAALFANWDKIFGRHEPTPSAITSTDISRSTPQNAGGAEVAVPAISPPPTSADTAIVDISGRWQDTDGYTYIVAEQGHTFSYRQIKDGLQVGTGTGNVDGRFLTYRFVSGDDRGNCQAEIGSDDRAFAGDCAIGAAHWPFRVTR